MPIVVEVLFRITWSFNLHCVYVNESKVRRLLLEKEIEHDVLSLTSNATYMAKFRLTR